MISVLKENNIQGTLSCCRNIADTDKINLLKQKISHTPVILLISHAYTKKSKFKLINAILFQHYISIWGYNDDKKVFYVYDSGTKGTLIKKDIPT